MVVWLGVSTLGRAFVECGFDFTFGGHSHPTNCFQHGVLFAPDSAGLRFSTHGVLLDGM